MTNITYVGIITLVFDTLVVFPRNAVCTSVGCFSAERIEYLVLNCIEIEFQIKFTGAVHTRFEESCVSLL